MNISRSIYPPQISVIDIEAEGLLCTSEGGNENVGETPGSDWDTLELI